MVQWDARNIGLALGGAVMVAATGVALLATPPAPTPVTPPAEPAPLVSGPASGTSAPALSVPTPEPAKPLTPPVETAMADGPPETPAATTEVEFLVRFKAPHPLAAAQALYAEGRQEAAMAAAERALRARRDTAGLCMERFTVGGAEVVLSPCGGVPAARAERHAQRWLSHLRGLTSVEYVDRNVVLQPGQGSRAKVEGPG